VADVPSGFSLTPPRETKKKNITTIIIIYSIMPKRPVTDITKQNTIVSVVSQMSFSYVIDILGAEIAQSV
jgi:hypothetical protein